MIQVKVRHCSMAAWLGPNSLLSLQDVRDFVLHLLSDEKAQQWLYVAVRCLPPPPNSDPFID